MAAVTLDQQRAQRASEMENALATGRLEGLEPSDRAKAIFQRYVDGELTLEEMGRAIDEYADREYGPVRIPRDERP
jgi:hypothetical protein